jgi:hypothetical protein
MPAVELETIYSAALERDFIRSQQRAPDVSDRACAVRPYSSRSAYTDMVCRVMQRQDRAWWTIAALEQTTGIKNSTLWSVVNHLRHRGILEPEHPFKKGHRRKTGHGLQPQRYRLTT